MNIESEVNVFVVVSDVDFRVFRRRSPFNRRLLRELSECRSVPPSGVIKATVNIWSRLNTCRTHRGATRNESHLSDGQWRRPDVRLCTRGCHRRRQRRSGTLIG